MFSRSAWSSPPPRLFNTRLLVLYTDRPISPRVLPSAPKWCRPLACPRVSQASSTVEHRNFGGSSVPVRIEPSPVILIGDLS